MASYLPFHGSLRGGLSRIGIWRADEEIRQVGIAEPARGDRRQARVGESIRERDTCFPTGKRRSPQFPLLIPRLFAAGEIPAKLHGESIHHLQSIGRRLSGVLARGGEKQRFSDSVRVIVLLVTEDEGWHDPIFGILRTSRPREWTSRMDHRDSVSFASITLAKGGRDIRRRSC